MKANAVAALKYALEEWRRERDGSAAQAARYREDAAELRADPEVYALAWEKHAADHQADADRAAEAVRDLEAELDDLQSALEAAGEPLP